MWSRSLLPTVLLAAAGLGAVVAQDNSSSNAAAQALALYPHCAIECLVEAIPKSVCGPTNVTCLCTNVPFNEMVLECVSEGCTTYEQLATQNASKSMCGYVPRDETALAPAVSVTFYILAVVVFLLRLCSLLPNMGRKPGWDDYMITLTVGFALPPVVFAVYLGELGLGKDMWTVSPHNLERILFFYYLGEIFYIACQTTLKLSLIFFLLRVFRQSTIKTSCYIALGLCVAYGVSFGVAAAFQCWPVSHIWMQLDDSHAGTCNNINVQSWLTAIFNIIMDVMVLCLPLRELYGLQINMKKKIMIIGMFCLGFVTTVVSIIRLQSLVKIANSTNITWDYLEGAYMSCVEMSLGIITACLPAVRTFFINIGVRVLATTVAASRGAGSAPSAGGSTLQGGNNVPRQGSFTDKLRQTTCTVDEGDFIPLVDVEAVHGRGGAGGGHAGMWRDEKGGGGSIMGGSTIGTHRTGNTSNDSL